MSEEVTDSRWESMDSAQKEFMELMTKKEELHPDLVPYLEKNRTLGTVLKHPLIIELFIQLGHCARVNRAYQYKLKYVEEEIAKKNWRSVLWMYERPYRMSKFAELSGKMTDDEYWDILGSIWTDSENLWQYNHIIENIIYCGRDCQEKIMDEEDREFLASLPETVTIYRGHQGRINRRGWSWSLSYHKARWFSHRFGSKKAKVSKATIKKTDIIAYLSGRSEFEIIADPHALKVKNCKPRVRPEWLQKILDEAYAGFALKTGSLHGLAHWEKVESNAIKLAKVTPDCDLKVVRLFALLHDCKRENELDDPDHGKRAAAYVEQLHNEKKLPLTDKQAELLAKACYSHNDGEVSEDPTIGVCWDADRLDLLRVGLVPSDEFLSTKAGKEMKWQM